MRIFLSRSCACETPAKITKLSITTTVSDLAAFMRFSSGVEARPRACLDRAGGGGGPPPTNRGETEPLHCPCRLALKKASLIGFRSELPRNLLREARIGHILERNPSVREASLGLDSSDDIFYARPRRHAVPYPRVGHDVIGLKRGLAIHFPRLDPEIDGALLGFEQQLFGFLQRFDHSSNLVRLGIKRFRQSR